ncbi:hypothetical protein PTW40_11920 [Lactiplantibacillus plantarum]|uniref:hypothetical protein n=1 Tax=Lactiplantibacillus plantarum TaxID=1590 RepID=UPI00237930DE|nr:hypothetical protein [Lactiplantibacillus plantarum]WDQ20416.1 hypothetical protein PTW40_11920 [Lactiplantibacillus plantarum]
MINQDNLNRIINTRTFETGTHKIANQLVISDLDARELLCTELVEHRLSKYSNNEIASLLDDKDPNLLWKVSYAAKDVISKHYKQLGKRAQMEHAAELEDVSTGIIKLADDNGNTTDISEFKLQQVVSMFPTTKSKTFVDMTLRYGKTETMAVLKLNSKQYQRRLRNATAYATKHRSKFDLVASQTRNRQLYTLNSLNELFSIIDKEGSIQGWIDSHTKLVNELLSISEVHYQGAVLNHWNTASKADQYAFIRECINAQAKAQDWLERSNEAVKEAGEIQSN